MSRKHPDTQISHEIADINNEFIALLTHPATRGAQHVLGLDAALVDALRGMAAEDRAAIARVPMLLAEFRPFPGFCEVRDDSDAYSVSTVTDPIWASQLQGFANRLLTCIWQTARRDILMTALSAGIATASCRDLSEFSFSRLCRCADGAERHLHVRLAEHPRYWPDLIRLNHSGTEDQRIASRLSLLQLAVGQFWGAGMSSTGPRFSS